MKRTLMISAVVALTACGGAKVAAISEADAVRGSEHFDGMTVNDLMEGQRLYTNSCGLCHGLKDPMDFSEEQWKHLVHGMVPKANSKGANLDAEKEQLILQYVLTMGPYAKQ